MPKIGTVLKKAAGVTVTSAFAIYVNSHPHWTTEHPIWTPCLYYAALIACVYLLVSFLLQWEWGQHLFSVPRHGSAISKKNIKDSPEWDKLVKELCEITEDVKGAGAQSVLLSHFCDQARHLNKCLVSLHAHWDYAGEKLRYPVGGKNEWNEWTPEKCVPLSDELYEFKILFMQYRAWTKLVFPGLDTSFIRIDYPSNAEYHEVSMALQEHVETLDKLSREVWEKENVMDSLHEKKN